jgi:hypothetical protein
MAPVGFDGEQTRIIFVRGVIAFATSSARTWKFPRPWSAR